MANYARKTEDSRFQQLQDFLVNDKMYSWRESFESPKIVMISEANRNLDHSEKQLQMYLFYEKATRDSVP